MQGRPASVNPKRGDEILARIFDSSKINSDNSRTGSVYPPGLGSGILGMIVDGEGNPIGLYWDLGTSPAGEKDTTIVCGRLKRKGETGSSVRRGRTLPPQSKTGCVGEPLMRFFTSWFDRSASIF
jgi:hypothetical protein